MNKTTKRAYALIPLILLFVAGAIYIVFLFFTKGAVWSSSKANTHLYTSGSLTTAGSVYSSDGKTLAKTADGRRVFNSNQSVRKATLHIVGDPTGIISTGVHSAFKSKLSGYSFVNGIYSLKKYGKGNDLTLALNSKACVTALNSMSGFNGTVGVYNYRTGALLCCVSLPTYDVSYPPSDLTSNPKYDGIFLNRFFSGVYTPGSTFKIITAICALENIPDIESQKFTCAGSMNLGGGKLICMNTHGELTFEQALNKSCNCAFAKIALQLGEAKLNKTAAKLGFNIPLKADGIKLAISTFNAADTSNLNLAWAGVGQYTTLVNPCHLLMIAGAIANGGQGISPYIINEITTQSGISIYKAIKKNSAITIDPVIASKIKRLLRSDVENWYGDSRFPNMKMCGKTGTAEIDGKESHSWFVGFSLREDFPVAVVVVAENAGSGSGVAMNTANAVLQKLAP